MRSAIKGGASEFVVVIGYRGLRLKDFLNDFASRAEKKITCIVNEEWTKPNGLSVLKAREALTEPFLLVMSDHLFDPTIAADLTSQPLADGEAMLAVDSNLANPLVDLEDVTRVQVAGGYIQSIGKGINPYNAFDTGIFYCTPALFDAIECSIATAGDLSLSGGIKVLASLRKARAFDIGDRLWLDIDEPGEAAAAELLLQKEIIRE